jgi:hypothetical protein
MNEWSRGDRIALSSLIVTIVGVVVAILTVPEFRRALGLTVENISEQHQIKFVGVNDNEQKKPEIPTPSPRTGSLADPKSSIAYQFNLIKTGDADKLKNCLTPRVRDDLTKEVLDKAKIQAAQYTLDDLYASAEMGEADGKKTAKVKMKSGRTLTTLIETDGQWLADSIWFK